MCVYASVCLFMFMYVTEVVVQVADFGLSRRLEGDYYKATDEQVPFKWAAPEVLQFHKYSPKSDVVSDHNTRTYRQTHTLAHTQTAHTYRQRLLHPRTHGYTHTYTQTNARTDTGIHIHCQHAHKDYNPDTLHL